MSNDQTQTTNGHEFEVLDMLVERLDPVIEVMNLISDNADFNGQTWEAIQKLREACSWLSVQRVMR